MAADAVAVELVSCVNSLISGKLQRIFWNLEGMWLHAAEKCGSLEAFNVEFPKNDNREFSRLDLGSSHETGKLSTHRAVPKLDAQHLEENPLHIDLQSRARRNVFGSIRS